AFLLRREPLQERPRVLVRAVLGPHDREDAELGERGFAAQVPLHALILLREEPVLPYQLRGDRLVKDRVGILGETRQLHADSWATSGNRAASTARATARPSWLGWKRSKALSGCGIMPKTLPASLRMPAMSSREPFGFPT